MGSETLVLGRFLLGEPAPAPEGLSRFRAVDQATGQRVDVLGPNAAAMIRPGAAERFQAAAALAASHPALLQPILSGVEERRPLLVRAPSEPLGALPRLDAGQAIALAAWLAPALSQAQDALGGILSPDDLVRDPEGLLRLAPRGLVAPAGALRASAYCAPEQQGGAPPLPGSALYGLGVMLFEATTGQPYRAGRRVRELDPSLPDSLDVLIASLCDANPEQRRLAAQTLPEAAPFSLPSSPPRMAATTERPAPTELSQRSITLSESWHLVLASPPPTAAARGRLAALLDLPRATLESMLERGETISVGFESSPTQAGSRVERLRELGVEALVVPPASPWNAALLSTAALGTVASIILALAGLLLGLLASVFLLAAAGAAMLVGVLLGALSFSLYRRGARRSAVEAAYTRQSRLRREFAAADDELSRALRRAHRTVLESDLHPVVRLDHERLLEELQTQSPLRPASELAREAQSIAQQAMSLREAPLPREPMASPSTGGGQRPKVSDLP